MDKLRVGIIGGGWMGVVHATSWQNNGSRAEIVAVADVSLPRAQAISDQFANGAAHTYGTIEDLLADSSVEAVDICLPHHLHADAILRSARAGKAILCEKPLCTSLDEAARIRNALRETGATFMAAHNQLFQPSLIEAQRLLADGVLGDPYMIRSIEAGQNRMFRTQQIPVEIAPGAGSFEWRTDAARMGGGEVLDTGYHSAYRLLALAGDRPTEVLAMTHRYFVQEISAEDTGVLLVRFASGIIGEIVTSWAFSFASGWQFEVAGEHGSLAGNATQLIHQLYRWPRPAERPNEPVHTYTREVTHFLDVVQRGHQSQATIDHAMRTLQLIIGAYRSAKEGRAVTLPEDPVLVN